MDHEEFVLWAIAGKSPVRRQQWFDPVNVIGGAVMIGVTILGLTQKPEPPWSGPNSDAQTAPDFEPNPDFGKSPADARYRLRKPKPKPPVPKSEKPIDPRNIT